MKTYITLIFTPQKSCPLYDNVEKYGIAGQDTDDNTAHAHCCWTPKAKHAPTICNIYCFSTATDVGRTCLNVTLYEHCLPLL